MSRAIPVRLAVAAVLLVVALGAVRLALAMPAANHVLSPADNNATITADIGDIITLALPAGAGFLWTTASSSNPAAVQPLTSGAPVQTAVWNVQAAGVVTITATGTPSCAGACSGRPIRFQATIDAGGAGQSAATLPAASAGPSVASVSYPAGYNLIGVPTGTVLTVPVYTDYPGNADTQTIPAGTPLTGGTGYWAIFAAATAVNLPAGSTSATVQAAAGQYTLVGNPSATAAATVQGADLLQQFNAALNVFLPVTTLAPGSAALAYSAAGGTLTVTAPTP
jgi:hypothetical protein